MGAIHGSCEKDLVWVGPYPFESRAIGDQRDPLAILKRGIDITKQIEAFGKEYIRLETFEPVRTAYVHGFIDSKAYARLRTL
jgi:hypothetical protein